MNKCMKCGISNVELMKISKSSTGKYSYYCRKCNTEKSRKYRKTKNGSEAVKRAGLKSYYKHYEKSLARSKISNAIYSKKIIKPTNCCLCNKMLKLEAHHPNYNQPYIVVWVCRSCHANLEKCNE